MNINSNTNTICLLGHPIKHSFSPTIHNYLFEKYSENNIYVCFDVKEDKLKDCVYGIKGLDIKGCNVTIPHKVNIIKYLDSIDDNAKLIGAVNTIKNKGVILKGYNTDGRGFVKSILDKDYDIRRYMELIKKFDTFVKDEELVDRYCIISDKKPKLVFIADTQELMQDLFNTIINYDIDFNNICLSCLDVIFKDKEYKTFKEEDVFLDIAAYV